MIVGLTGAYNYRGIPLEKAFARIDAVSSYETNCSASINIYATEQAWLNGEGYLEQIYPVEFKKQRGDNVGDDHTQGYRYVKSLELFAEWTGINN